MGGTSVDDSRVGETSMSNSSVDNSRMSDRCLVSKGLSHSTMVNGWCVGIGNLWLGDVMSRILNRGGCDVMLDVFIRFVVDNA